MQTTLTWHRVTERLPNLGERVLVAYKYGGVDMVTYQPADTVYWWSRWLYAAMWAYVEMPEVK